MNPKHLKEQLDADELEQLRNYIKKLINGSKISVFNRKFNKKNSVSLEKEQFQLVAQFLLDRMRFINILDIQYILEYWLYSFAEKMNLPDPKLVVDYLFNSLCSEDTIDSMTNTVLDELTSLPREYRVLVPIMHNDHADVTFLESIELSDKITLFQMTDDRINKEFPIIDKFDDPQYRHERYHPPVDHLYISIKAYGCYSFFSWSSLYKSFHRTLSLALSALLVNEVILLNSADNTSHIPDDDSYLPNYIPNNSISSTYGPGYSYLYPSSMSEAPIYHKFPEAERLFLRSLSGFAFDLGEVSAFEKVKIQKGETESRFVFTKTGHEKLNNIKKLFNSNGLEARRVKTALEWFFQGLLNDNKTFSYVQYAIALEALFGDPNHNNVQQRISDRCAFVLAENSAERNRVKKEIEAIYEVRSRIVHDGNRNLNNEDLECYSSLGKYLQKALSKEMENLP